MSENPVKESSAPVSRADQLKMEIQYLSTQCTSMFEVLGKKLVRLESLLTSPQGVGEALKKEIKYISHQNMTVYESVKKEIGAIAREVGYLAQQNLSVYNMTTGYVDQATSALEEKLVGKLAQLEEAIARIQAPSEIDGDALAEKIAEKIELPVQDVKEAAVAEIDYDVLAEKIVENTPPIDYDYLAGKITEGVSLIDYNTLSTCVAEKLAAVMPATESITAEAIAESVLSKMQEVPIEADVQGLADAIVERLHLPSMAIDSDELADAVAARIVIPEAEIPEWNVEELSDAVAAKIPMPDYNSDELAEKVASKIVVPEWNVDEVSDAVAVKITFDYDAIAERIVETASSAVDYDAVAEKLAEKLNGTQDVETYLAESGIEPEDPTDKVVRAVEESGDKTNELVNEVIRLLNERTVLPVPVAVPVAEEEPVAEEQAVAETAEEEPETEPERETEKAVRLKRSFECKLRQSEEELKFFYSSLKNELLAYQKVHSTVSWNGDRFNFGRETVAKVVINGKTLCAYFALDPDKYPITKYHHKDVGNVKAYEGTPMMIKIKSGMGLKKALTLVGEMLEGKQAVRTERSNEDFVALYAYKSDEELLAEGLIKATLTEKKDLTAFR